MRQRLGWTVVGWVCSSWLVEQKGQVHQIHFQSRQQGPSEGHGAGNQAHEEAAEHGQQRLNAAVGSFGQLRLWRYIVGAGASRAGPLSRRWARGDWPGGAPHWAVTHMTRSHTHGPGRVTVHLTAVVVVAAHAPLRHTALERVRPCQDARGSKRACDTPAPAACGLC